MIINSNRAGVLSLLLFILFIGSGIELSAQPLNSPCLFGKSFRIVVLGSSTAAGAGASGQNAWVNRYRAHLDSINPNNEVINLARGGFVSYRIMPDNFVPAVSGRPMPDSLHNIDEALRRNPDAIIINLPSNDRQYPMEEQLANFDSLYRWSNRNNVAIWICTTQPITVSGAYQAAVKDSINQQYGFFALDFWTTLADTNNLIKSVYAADGVHLNDSGHAVIYNSAVNKDIPGYLFSQINQAVPDYSLIDIVVPSKLSCGDSVTQVAVHVINTGRIDSNLTQVITMIVDTVSGAMTIHNDTVPIHGTQCIVDTFFYQINTINGGYYTINSVVMNVNDTVFTNNNGSNAFRVLAKPGLFTSDGFICHGDAINIIVNPLDADTLLWFSDLSGDSVIWTGNELQTPALFTDTNFYVQTVAGPLSFKEEIFTTDNSNVNFNGTMFDIAAIEDLVIDSFSIKVASLGWQVVEIYNRSGTHIGNELNSSAWSFYVEDSVFVSDVDRFVLIDFPGINLSAGDSLGVYLQLKTAGSNLSYRNDGTSHTRSTGEMVLFTGSGVAHNFAANYFPRDFNGKVHYHYGFNPNGTCASDREIINISILGEPVRLGNDTSVLSSGVLNLTAPGGFASYLWSDGSTGQSITVQAPPDSQIVWVETLSFDGCISRDTMMVYFVSGVYVDERNELNDIKVFPNPSDGVIYFNNVDLSETVEVKVYDMTGKLVLNNRLDHNYLEFNPGIENGFYSIRISTRKFSSVRQVILWR